MNYGHPLEFGTFITPAGEGAVALARRGEDLGYDLVTFQDHPYQPAFLDTWTLMSWVAGVTERIHIAANVLNVPLRQPAVLARSAASLDLLSGGRFRLGLGVSGPQVSEGWYGVPFAKPLARTREYLEVISKALARETVEYAGEHHTLPVPGGPGKPLKLMLHPHRERIPTYLAAIGPKNLELAGELTDGLLAVFWAPEFADEQLASIRAGRDRAGRADEPFDVVPSVPLVIGDDVEKAAEPVRPYSALYVGGMGSREKNFYNALAVRMGYGDAAREVQDLYLAKKQRDAAAAVPLEFIDRTSLLGPVDRVADRMREFAASGVTTLSLAIHATDLEASIRQLRLAAEAYDKSGVA
jgi:F420-dependent oxidoreductase-like protein